MPEVADEIAYLKTLLEESRVAIKALRMEVAELKLVLRFQGFSVAPAATEASSGTQQSVEIALH